MEQYTLIGHPLGHSMSPFIHERLVCHGRQRGKLYADGYCSGASGGQRAFPAQLTGL